MHYGKESGSDLVCMIREKYLRINALWRAVGKAMIIELQLAIPNLGTIMGNPLLLRLLLAHHAHRWADRTSGRDAGHHCAIGDGRRGSVASRANRKRDPSDRISFIDNDARGRVT